MTLRLVVQTIVLLAYILLASFVILNAETQRCRGFIFLEFFGRLRESKTLARFEGANGSLCNRNKSFTAHSSCANAPNGLSDIRQKSVK